MLSENIIFTDSFTTCLIWFMLKHSNFFLLTICIIIAFFDSDCKKDTNCKLPHAYISLTIDVTSVQYAALSNIGGYVYITGGVKGIVIYREGNDQFIAYDRLCTYQSAGCLALTVTGGLYLIDTYCKSKFNILNGGIVNGPAKCALITYQTNFDGQYLQITN